MPVRVRAKLPRYILIGFGALAVIFFGVWLSGRAGLFSSYPKQAITLRIWSIREDPIALKKIISDYEKHHPNVSITLQPQDETTYSQALDAAKAASATPDIYVLEPEQFAKSRASLAPAPSRVTSPDVVRNNFIPGIAERVISGKSVYGLPLSVANLGLYYHKSALTQSGLGAPATWADFLTAAQKLTQRNGLSISRSGVALGTPVTDPDTTLLQVLMQQNGATMTSGSKLTFTSPEAGTSYYPGPKALDFFTSFANPSKSSYSWSDAMGDAVSAFKSGQAAMYIGSSSRLVELKSTVGSDLGVAPLPSIKNSAARNQVDFNTYGVSDTSRNIFVAWDFLKFATSSKEQAIYLNQTRGLSPRLDLAKTESKQGDLSPFAAQLPESHTWALAGWPETAQAFQGSMAGVLTNKSTSAQALEQSKAQLTPLLQALTP